MAGLCNDSSQCGPNWSEQCPVASVYPSPCLDSNYDPCSKRPLHNSLHQPPFLDLFSFKVNLPVQHKKGSTKCCTHPKVTRPKFFLTIWMYWLFAWHTKATTQNKRTETESHRTQPQIRDWNTQQKGSCTRSWAQLWNVYFSKKPFLIHQHPKKNYFLDKFSGYCS